MLSDGQRPKRGGGIVARTPADSSSLTNIHHNNNNSTPTRRNVAAAASATLVAASPSPVASSVLVQLSADTNVAHSNISSVVLQTPRNQVAAAANTSYFNDTLQSVISAAAAAAEPLVSPKSTYAADFQIPHGVWKNHAYLNFEGDVEYIAALHQRIVGAAPPQCKWDSFAAAFNEQLNNNNSNSNNFVGGPSDDANVEHHRQNSVASNTLLVDERSVDAIEIDFERLTWVQRLTVAGAAMRTAQGTPIDNNRHNTSGMFLQRSPSSASLFMQQVSPIGKKPRETSDLHNESSLSRPGSGATVLSFSGNFERGGTNARITAASLASLQQQPTPLTSPKVRHLSTTMSQQQQHQLQQRRHSLHNNRGGGSLRRGATGGTAASLDGMVSQSNSMLSYRSGGAIHRGEFGRGPVVPQLQLAEARILTLACDLPPGTRVLPAAFMKSQQEQRHPAFFPSSTGGGASNHHHHHNISGGGGGAADSVTATLFIETIMAATTPQSEDGIAACERAFAGPWHSLFSRWIPTVFFQLQCMEKDAVGAQLLSLLHLAPVAAADPATVDNDLVSFDVLGMLLTRLWARFAESALSLHPILIAQCVRHAMSAVPRRIDMSTAGQLLLDFAVDVFLENVSTKELTALLGAITALANDPLTECDVKQWALSSSAGDSSNSEGEERNDSSSLHFAWHVDFASNTALAAILKIPVASSLNRVLVDEGSRDNNNDNDRNQESTTMCEHGTLVQNVDGGFTLHSAPCVQHQQQQTSPIKTEDSFRSAAVVVAGGSPTTAGGTTGRGGHRHFLLEPMIAAPPLPLALVERKEDHILSHETEAEAAGDLAATTGAGQARDHYAEVHRDDDLLSWSAQQYEDGQKQGENFGAGERAEEEQEQEQQEQQASSSSSSSPAWGAVLDLLSSRHVWRPSGRDLVEALTIQIQRALDSREGLPSWSLVAPADGLLSSAARWDTHATVAALDFPAAGSHIASGLVFGLRDSWASLVSEASKKQQSKKSVGPGSSSSSNSNNHININSKPAAATSQRHHDSPPPQQKPPRGPNDSSSNSTAMIALNTTSTTTVNYNNNNNNNNMSRKPAAGGGEGELPVWIHATVNGRSELVTSVGWETLRARFHPKRGANHHSGSDPTSVSSTSHAGEGTLRRRHAAAAAAALLAEAKQRQEQFHHHPSTILDPTFLREEKECGITSTPVIDAQSIIRKGNVSVPVASLQQRQNVPPTSPAVLEPAVACFVSLASLSAGVEPEKAGIFVSSLSSSSGTKHGGIAQSARELAERVVRDCDDVTRPESLFCFAFDLFSGAVGESDRALRRDLVLGDGGVSLLTSLAAAAAVDHGFEWERGLFSSFHHQQQQQQLNQAPIAEIPRLQVLVRVPTEVNTDLEITRKQKHLEKGRVAATTSSTSPVSAALRSLLCDTSTSMARGGSPRARGRSFNDTLVNSVTSRVAVMSSSSSSFSRSPLLHNNSTAAAAAASSRAGGNWIQRTSGVPRRTPARGVATPDPCLKVSARSPFSSAPAMVAAAATTPSAAAAAAGGVDRRSPHFHFLPARRTPPPPRN